MTASTKLFAGVFVCVVGAVLLSLTFNDDTSIRALALLMCLVVVLVTALFCGRWAAILGGIAASLTFAVLLFPPFGSLQIKDHAERVMLVLFQLTAAAVSFLGPRNLAKERLSDSRDRASKPN